MRNLNKKVFNRLEKVSESYKFLNNDVCIFFGIKWRDYYDKFEDVSDIVIIVVCVQSKLRTLTMYLRLVPLQLARFGDSALVVVQWRQKDTKQGC